jgi:cytochrome P450
MTTTELPTTHGEIDLSARSFWALPLEQRDEAFATLRRENPVPWSRPVESDLLPQEANTRGFWSLTKFDDIRRASRNPEVFSSADGVIMEDFPPAMTEVAQSFIAMDEPRHTQLRGITDIAFKPRNLRLMESWIQEQTRTLIDEMAPKGQGDFIEDVSNRLPGRIFGRFWGLTEGTDMYDKTIDAAQRLPAYTDPEVCGGLSGLELFGGAVQDLHETAATLAPLRRANPGEDLMSWVVQAEWEGQRMTDHEIACLFTLVAVASNDTTRHASAHAIYSFSRFPEQKALLLENLPLRLDGAVEEVLRWASPLLHMRRTATRDITVRGSHIKAGDKVVLWYYSGNRDEEFFDNPHTFDILRTPNRHVTFGGGGPHVCLGAALARFMLRAILTEVYTRIPDIQASTPDFLVANFINGVKRLPATWTPERSG